MATGERSALGRIGKSLAGIGGAEHADPARNAPRSSSGSPSSAWRWPADWRIGLVGGVGRLAARLAGRAHAGDGHPARGAAGRADAVPGSGRLAAGARERAGTQHPGRRIAGRDDRAVRRQDRNADGQSHGGQAAVVRAAVLRQPGTPASRAAAGGVARRAGVRGAGQPSPRIRPDGVGDRRRRTKAAGRHRTPARRLDPGRRLPFVGARCWRCRASGSRPTGASG